MTVLEFFREKRRMCDSYNECHECPLSGHNNGHGISCSYLEDKYPWTYIAIVEKWIKGTADRRIKGAGE